MAPETPIVPDHTAQHIPFALDILGDINGYRLGFSAPGSFEPLMVFRTFDAASSGYRAAKHALSDLDRIVAGARPNPQIGA